VIAVAVATVALVFALRQRFVREPAASEQDARQLWVVHHNAVSPDMPEASRHWELATLLKEHGWQTTVFSMGFNHKERRYLRPTSPLRPIARRSEQGVDFVWLYTTPYRENDWRRYVSSASFLVTSAIAGSLQSPRPDVVIGVSPHLLSGLAGWVVAKIRRVPFVLEVQDLWPESIVQLGMTNPVIVKPLEWLERFLYHHADHIVSLSEGITGGITARGTAPEKVTLISNAAMRPKPIDKSARNSTRKRMGWIDKTVAIWIGAHGPANGLDVLVDVAQEMRDDAVRLVLVGDGPAKPALVRAAQGLSNIEFLDPVPKAEVQELLRAADIGIIVHRDTAAVKGVRPNKLFDYMAAGLPILLNLDGEPRRLAEEAGAGVFVEAESAPALVDGLRQLASSPAKREALGASGYETVRTAHSREDTARDLATVLDSLPSSS
jgi:glycosyltransferase involved in cell wall biosynthesis